MSKHPHLSKWDLLPVLGVAVLACFYVWILPRLPEPVPTHFDAAGRANGWTAKAQLPWIIFGAPTLFCLVLWGIGRITARMERDPLKAKAALFQPLRGCLGLGISLLMVGCLAAALGGVAFVHLGAAAFFLCLIVGTILMARKTKDLLRNQPDAGHYRWGLFYLNPDDRRVWVEKRLGVGWTLNYAHRAAWWMTALFLLAVPAAIGLAILLQR